MLVLLGADPPAPRGLATLANLWMLWLPLLVGGLAILLLLPRPRPFSWFLGAVAGLASLVLGGLLLVRGTGLTPETVLFYAFAALAITSAALLVTQQNPARAALSFTLVVLSTGGLFLLLAAPFLMAATIIIYAGAIIVTFLFVLMLAQQAGLGNADARSREPELATLTGFLLLATILYVLHTGYGTAPLDALLVRAERVHAAAEEAAAETDPAARQQALAAVRAEVGEATPERPASLFQESKGLLASHGLKDLRNRVEAAEDPLIFEPETAEALALALGQLADVLREARVRVSQPQPTAALSSLSGTPAGVPAGEVRRDAKTRLPAMPAENAAHLGRSLFTDYLLPVELAGALLLAATVGAIAIAQRRDPVAAAAGDLPGRVG